MGLMLKRLSGVWSHGCGKMALHELIKGVKTDRQKTKSKGNVRVIYIYYSKQR